MNDKLEAAISEKMRGGLSRDQAMQVLEDQAADDAIRAERDAAAEKARLAEQARVAKSKTAGAPATPPPSL